MKRYWVFVGADYYANGGMADFVGMSDSKDEAQQLFERERDLVLERVELWWGHIIDSKTGEIIQKATGDYSGDLEGQWLNF